MSRRIRTIRKWSRWGLTPRPCAGSLAWWIRANTSAGSRLPASRSHPARSAGTAGCRSPTNIKTMGFELFLKDLTPSLKAIAFKLNRGFSSLDEQDLFQEAVMFLWEHYKAGDFGDKTRS